MKELINKNNHIESVIMYDDKLAYKYFTLEKESVLQNKYKKLVILMEGHHLDHTVMPLQLLFKEGKFCGYSMPFYEKTINLTDIKKSSVSKFLKLFKEISQAVYNIHQDPRKIIISDLNSSNIIVDKRGDFHFVDVDSWRIGNLGCNCASGLFKYFLTMKDISSYKETKNIDVLQIYLLFIFNFFDTTIHSLDMKEYDRVSEQVETLKNLRQVIASLKDGDKIDDKLPYLNELIADNDLDKKLTFSQILK